MTTSSVSSTTSSTSSTSSTTSQIKISTGNAQDTSGMTPGNITLSLAEAVNVKVQPYLDQATNVQNEITANQSKISAYTNMQTLLQALETASANLSKQALQGTDVFNSRAAALTASANNPGTIPSDPSSLFSASVADNTATGTHSVVVNQIAKAESDLSSQFGPTATPLSGLAGGTATVTIAEASNAGAAQSVTLTSTMTLSDIAMAINAVSSTNGVTASVVAVSSTQSVLVLNGVDTDQAIQFTDPSGALSTLGIATGGTATNQVQAAQPANLTVDGVTNIQRATNSINDIIPGVTFNLNGADTNTTVTMSIGPNTTATATAVQAFVTAYNNWQDFVAQNEATNTDGSAVSGAVLFGDQTLREASLEVDSALNEQVNNMGLANIGLSLDTNNHLVIDSTQLAQQLTSNYNNVAALFSSTGGIADTMYQTSRNYANPYGGTISNIVNGLQTQDATLNQTLTDWTTRAQNYANFLLTQYAALTQKMGQANQTYQTLQAILNQQFARN